jgi:hypothetical protein
MMQHICTQPDSTVRDNPVLFLRGAGPLRGGRHRECRHEPCRDLPSCALQLPYQVTSRTVAMMSLPFCIRQATRNPLVLVALFNNGSLDIE